MVELEAFLLLLLVLLALLALFLLLEADFVELEYAFEELLVLVEFEEFEVLDVFFAIIYLFLCIAQLLLYCGIPAMNFL